MSLFQEFLRPDNRLTTCPPGRIEPGGEAPLILVASLRRSGTHLLIDAILNNFAVYKRRPLYIDLDQYLLQGHCVDELLRCRGYIVKTHFPQVPSPDKEEYIRAVAERAIVLSPTRSPERVFHSEAAFTPDTGARLFAQQYNAFREFWRQYPVLSIPFDHLCTRDNYESVLASIAEQIGIAPNNRVRYPIPKDRRALIYWTKFLTRIFGKYNPVINTTIAFAKTPKRLTEGEISSMLQHIKAGSGNCQLT